MTRKILITNYMHDKVQVWGTSATAESLLGKHKLWMFNLAQYDTTPYETIIFMAKGGFLHCTPLGNNTYEFTTNFEPQMRAQYNKVYDINHPNIPKPTWDEILAALDAEYTHWVNHPAITGWKEPTTLIIDTIEYVGEDYPKTCYASLSMTFTKATDADIHAGNFHFATEEGELSSVPFNLCFLITSDGTIWMNHDRINDRSAPDSFKVHGSLKLLKSALAAQPSGT